MKNSKGFTLIEMMITISILTVVMLGLYSINESMSRAAIQQESLARLRDDGRESLRYMTRRLRMGKSGTVVAVDGDLTASIGTQPVQAIQFQMVADVDGNGTTISQDFTVGSSAALTFTPDFDDANEDGEWSNQLVHLDENNVVVQVLTNNLNPEGGFACIRTAGGLQLTLIMYDDGNGGRPPVTMRLDQVVAVRN